MAKMVTSMLWMFNHNFFKKGRKEGREEGRKERRKEGNRGGRKIERLAT